MRFKKFNIYKNCKICNSKNKKKIISISFNKPKFKSYINSYYTNVFYKYFKLKDFKKYNFILNKCRKCNFIWQEMVMNRKLSVVLYEKVINAKESLNKSLKKNYNLKSYILENVLINFLIGSKNNILDFSAGWGQWASNLKFDKKLIFCTEFSKKKKNYIKKKLKIKVIDELKDSKYKFSYVKCNQVLEHVDDFNHFFLILNNICEKNCFINISVPAYKRNIDINQNNYLKKGPFQPFEHVNTFNNYNLTKLFNQNCFKKIKTKILMKLFFKILIRKPNLVLSMMKIIYDHYFTTNIIFQYTRCI